MNDIHHLQAMQSDHSSGDPAVSTGSAEAAPQPAAAHPAATHHSPGRATEPLVHPPAYPPVHRRDGKLFVSEGAPLPTDICICSGRRAAKVVDVPLRNPSNPRTWFGRRPVLTVGLSKKHRENQLIAHTLTWSLLVTGVVLFATGAITLNFVLVAAGLLAALGCGYFRARSPIWSPESEAEPIEVAGAGEKFRERFPEWEASQ